MTYHVWSYSFVISILPWGGKHLGNSGLITRFVIWQDRQIWNGISDWKADLGNLYNPRSKNKLWDGLGNVFGVSPRSKTWASLANINPSRSTLPPPLSSLLSLSRLPCSWGECGRGAAPEFYLRHPSPGASLPPFPRTPLPWALQWLFPISLELFLISLELFAISSELFPTSSELFPISLELFRLIAGLACENTFPPLLSQCCFPSVGGSGRDWTPKFYIKEAPHPLALPADGHPMATPSPACTCMGCYGAPLIDLWLPMVSQNDPKLSKYLQNETKCAPEMVWEKQRQFITLHKYVPTWSSTHYLLYI